MQRPKIVAEIGACHNGSLDRAMHLIEAARCAGADAVKIQAYRADMLTLDCDGPGFTIGAEGPWQGRRLIDLYREAETPAEWWPKLFRHAKAVGIECFASVFDVEAVFLLERLRCPAYKIASFEIVDTGLIRRGAATGKPLILSTGMASDSDIAEALSAASGSPHVTLLHCVSAYPARAADANLGRMAGLRARFTSRVGLSDHTMGIAIPVAATALGAAMIEKHLTLSRAKGGPDASFSLEPDEFRAMVQACHDAADAMDAPAPRAEPYTDLRRSLYAVADIAAGEAITEANVRSIRPGYGMAPKLLPTLMGRRAARVIAAGTPMSEELVQ